jgi:hypothetical protein
MFLVWWILGGLAALYLIQTMYLATVLKWEEEQTVGLGYYGKPAAEREKFKRVLVRHAKFLTPVLWFNGLLAKMEFRKASIHYKGIAAPGGSTAPETFAKAEAYRVKPGDVFVVTQMKCGTTWMQHVVYEVLNRGDGNLVETGTALYAVSPWIEGRRSVSLEKAPKIGSEKPSRILKTHLPARLCPFSKDARYIYVARHPVSCYASCVDFVRTNVGGMAPSPAAFEEWFTSTELMWWGTWPDHVRGWYERSKRETNVLFLYFEDMKDNLPAVVKRVAEFLGMKPLSEPELARVVAKCGFDYMQTHQANFEMQPPHILQTNAALFVRGSRDRHKDVAPDVKRRILAWAAKGLEGSDFPVASKYPDVRSGPGA